jgi:hypothetical protein
VLGTVWLMFDMLGLSVGSLQSADGSQSSLVLHVLPGYDTCLHICIMLPLSCHVVICWCSDLALVGHVTCSCGLNAIVHVFYGLVPRSEGERGSYAKWL